MYATTISMHSSYLQRRTLNVVVIKQHYLQVKEILQQENVQHKFKGYEMKEDGLLIHHNRIYVPSSREIMNLELREMHNVPYVEHPG
jgi:glyceraldehyde-3-phosphate dehydrogenase/erythrose-4-phosphate dehydrogenase